MNERVFYHSGDLGDIIACLPAIKALGEGKLVIGYSYGGQRESMRGERFESIKPLLEEQHYIHEVEWTDLSL